MQKAIYILVALVAVILGLVVSSTRWQSEQPINALYYQQPRVLDPFSLASTTEGDVNNAFLVGNWTLLFLGYTYCPDICPTTLAKLNNLQPKLQALTESPVRVGLISVDPMRDTPDRLREYIGFFNNPQFFAATGEHPQLFPFTRNLGLVYGVPDDTDNPNYLVNHSASVVLINPQGNIQAVFKPEFAKGKIPVVDGQAILSDFTEIVRRYEQ